MLGKKALAAHRRRCGQQQLLINKSVRLTTQLQIFIETIQQGNNSQAVVGFQKPIHIGAVINILTDYYLGNVTPRVVECDDDYTLQCQIKQKKYYISVF